MDMTMNIAALSMGLSAAKYQQAVDISVTKKAMSLQETQAAALIESLQTAIPQQPVSFGHQLDVLV